MAGIEKIKFNPFIKGNFDYIKDYDGDVESLQNDVNHHQTINSETIERVDGMESIIAMLQSGQIIPAERQGTIENGTIIYHVTYENYVTLKGAKKFFIILDNPLQTGSTAAEELVKLKIQTNKLKQITIPPPTVSDTPSITDPYAGMVGYNIEKNLGILVSGGYVYFKQGSYAKIDVFDLKCTYIIDEGGKMQLAQYVEPTPPVEIEENEEQEITGTSEPAPQPIIIVISGRNENTITFETTNGYFQLSDNDTVNFTDSLIITEGEDTWSVLRVMHKDNAEAKLKDILEKRVLMRAIIDEKDSRQDSAYIIGGIIESTPSASFTKANAYVIENLEEDLVLNNENFPSENIIYIIKAKNDFNIDGLARVIFNNNNTGFTTDRSFEIWLEKDTGQRDMLLMRNGTVESNALNRGECVRLFFDYQTSNWSIVYLASDNANNTLVTSNDNTIKVTQTGQTFDLSRRFYLAEAGSPTRYNENDNGYVLIFRCLAGSYTTNHHKGVISGDIFTASQADVASAFGSFVCEFYKNTIQFYFAFFKSKLGNVAVSDFVAVRIGDYYEIWRKYDANTKNISIIFGFRILEYITNYNIYNDATIYKADLTGYGTILKIAEPP